MFDNDFVFKVDLGDVPAGMITTYNKSGEKVRLGRSDKFTNGMKGRADIDDLIATRAL